MWFLPYEHFTIHTPLSVEQAENKLQEVTGPRSLFIWGQSNHQPYQGRVEGQAFDIRRSIHYRNSFLPMIHGSIQPAAGGSVIDIRMSLHILVMVFMIFWLGGVGIAFFAALGSLILQSSQGMPVNGAPFLFVPAGMFVFGFALMNIPFKIEASKSKQFLRDLFNDRMPDANDPEEGALARFFSRE